MRRRETSYDTLGLHNGQLPSALIKISHWICYISTVLNRHHIKKLVILIRKMALNNKLAAESDNSFAILSKLHPKTNYGAPSTLMLPRLEPRERLVLRLGTQVCVSVWIRAGGVQRIEQIMFLRFRLYLPRAYSPQAISKDFRSIEGRCQIKEITCRFCRRRW